MTIARRLYILIIVTMIGLLGLTGLGFFQMDKIFTAASYANINTVPSLIVLDDASTNLALINQQVWQYVVIADPDKRKTLIEKMAKEKSAYEAALSKYEKELISDDTDTGMLNTDRADLNALQIVYKKAISLVDESKAEEARDVLLENQALSLKVDEDFYKHREYNRKLGDQGAADGQGTLRTANWIAALITLLVGGVVGTLAWTLTRKITSALAQAIHIAKTVASGDLTSQIQVESHDEIGQLLQALKEMNESLIHVVTQVYTGAETIATASGEVASGNMDLSARTEHQASSLEETASSMEELTSTVKQNADNARQANQLALTASNVAVKGGSVVAEVVHTMGSINDSAKKIVDIIGVIDGIAFQTNILALNAAVEAARAGEQGRGFAVVASEVRNLAQRSASAAKEIKTLIGDSVEKVDIGTTLVDQAGLTMQEIVDSVKRVSDIISEIASASQEQTSGIEQINHAVAQMDEVTQQNAALVEQAAAATQSLQEQAAKLNQVVATFRLDGMHKTATARVSATPPKSTNPKPALKAKPAAAKPAAPPKLVRHEDRAADSEDGWETF